MNQTRREIDMVLDRGIVKVKIGAKVEAGFQQTVKN